MSKEITEYLNSDPQLIRLKKNETLLSICGSGVIFFGVWSLIKSIMSIVLYKGTLNSYFSQYQNAPVLRNLAYGMVFFILSLDVVLRLYVGLTAISESRGKRKKSTYIVVAFAMLFFTVFGVVGSFMFLQRDISLLTSITTILVETTSSLTLLQMLISVINVRRIKKKIGSQERMNEMES